MLDFQDGGSQDDGPLVGKAGYCEGNRVVVSSQVVGHGGVNMDVSDANGAVPPRTALGADIPAGVVMTKPLHPVGAERAPTADDYMLRDRSSSKRDCHTL